MVTIILRFLLITTILILCNVNGWTKDSKESIFASEGDNPKPDYCKFKCNENPHTLCNPASKPGCDDYRHVPISDDLRNNLLNAHNGLRNRAASKHEISSMKRMRWDVELQRMAEIHIRKCGSMWSLDECTQLPRDSSQRYTLINQNTAFVISKYLPKYYETSIVTTWYTESQLHGYSKADKEKWVQYTKITNYTQMIYPLAERIGCSLGKFSNGYRLVCNYYPSIELNKKAYRIGAPCGECPRNMPLCDDFFDSLCIGDYAIHLQFDHWLIAILILLCLLYAHFT